MTKDDSKILVEGEVTKILGGWEYEVKLKEIDDFSVRAKAAWKLKQFKIKIIPWDLVQLELSEYDPTIWRIVYRWKMDKKKEFNKN